MRKRKKLINKNTQTILNRMNIIKSVSMYNNVHNASVNNKLNKVNSRLKYLCSHMVKKELTQDNLILPSIIKVADKNLQIKPFWNNKIKEISNKIYLPTFKNTKKLKRVQNKTLKSKTWFNTEEYVPIKKQKIDKTFELKNIPFIKGNVTKVKKIKIYISSEQKMYIRQVIGTYRYFYNRAVSYINNYDKTTNTSKFYVYPSVKGELVKVICPPKYYCSFSVMRKLLKTKLPEWILPKFTSHLIDRAIAECSTRFSTCVATYCKTNKPFKLSYKQKKNKIQTINLEKGMVRCNKVEFSIDLFRRWKINGKYVFRNIKCSEKLPSDYLDLNLSFNTRLNSFWLNVPYKVSKTNSDKNKICAIDQGVITPFVIYSTNNVVSIGNKCYKDIYKKCKEADTIQSKMECDYFKGNGNEQVNITRKVKYRLRKAFHRKLEKVKNMKDEIHNKTVKYLTDNFKGIILPPFETKNMVGKLSSKVSRSMYNLSFYKFRTKLKSKAKEKNVKVYEFTEPYTSKTCGKCGKINYDLEGSRIFNCSNCDLITDRDINGSRNIFLRNIPFII